MTGSPWTRAALLALSFAAAVGTVACDKGPAQKAGATADKALDTDKPAGKGPAEKAGKEIDQAAEKAKDADRK